MAYAPGARSTAEAGIRWDRYRYDDGLEFDVTSPRLNVVYSFSDDAELRAAWGLCTSRNRSMSCRSKTTSRNFLRRNGYSSGCSATRTFRLRALSARLDIYDKAYDDLRPRFENALDPVQLIPEGSADRVRIDASEARARGVELTLRREAERGLSGWVSLAVARAEDYETEIGRRAAGNSARPWPLAVVGPARNGISASPAFCTAALPPRPSASYPRRFRVAVTKSKALSGRAMARRLGAYLRIDMRLNRDVLLATASFALFRGHQPARQPQRVLCRGLSRRGRTPGARCWSIEKSYWLPILPSVGVQWEF